MAFKLKITILFLLLFSSAAFAKVKLPKLISDGMVLQRDAEVKIWGWADAGEKISLKFMTASYSTSSSESGKWEIILSDLKAGGPYNMEIAGSNTIRIENILVGDVWVCSGQSNMEINLQRASPLYEKEIAEAGNSYVRYFQVPKTYDFNTPYQDLSGGKWQSPDPQTVLSFSAVAYFFALELYDTYQVPIGLIQSALGGSPAEAWISEDAIKQFPKHYEEAQRFKDAALIDQIETQDRTRIGKWHQNLKAADEGYKNPGKSWHQPDLNTTDWPSMKIPAYWADEAMGPINGVVWFRKAFTVPASMAGKAAKLLMGRIVDADSVYVNGLFVGTTTYQYPPRRYEIPENVLKEGKNIITARIVNERGKGGFVSDKPYEISVDQQKIDLKGAWQYRLGAKMEPLESQTFIRWKPVGLFNAMISPLLNYRIKGVIWYQGESNAGRPEEYQTLFPAMITNWRDKWEQGEFPFLFVQLANFMEAKEKPSESDWAMLREAQLKTLSLPNTGMAVTIDIGEWNDIHPLNKKDVGKRLALAARKLAYKEKDIVYSGPIYESMKVKGKKVKLSFKHTGKGLTTGGNTTAKQFAVAGKDRKFVWAKVKVRKNKVIVWSDKIPEPIAVRYAWADNPSGANLYNKEGLPASPFRTDKW